MKTKILVIGIVSVLVVLAFSLNVHVINNADAKEVVKVRADDDKTPPGLDRIPPGLEKIVFIHYKKGHGKPLDKPGKPGGGKEDTGPNCYDFLARGVKWKKLGLVCFVDSLNNSGLTSGEVLGEMVAGASTWDSVTGPDLFNGFVIAPEGSLSWDGDSPDGKNELVFADYPESGVIAVTVVWGYFSGPPGIRKIFEFDILFNTDYQWGVGEAAKMDLQNIAVHEIGHGLGLADIYDSSCADVTMYGFSTEGEIKKRDLDPSDVTGIQELYGAP